MNESPGTLKSFESVLSDYAFFLRHSTEALETRRKIQEALSKLALKDSPVRFLDIGCGDGELAESLTQNTPGLKGRTQFCLVEPAESSRNAAIKRLAATAVGPVEEHAFLTDKVGGVFDIVLANHSLYYVSDLPSVVRTAIAKKRPGGLFVGVMETSSGPFIQLWKTFFALAKKPLPFHLSEELQEALTATGTSYTLEQVSSAIAFPDTTANRRHIARFLLEPHYALVPEKEVLSYFDRFSERGTVRMEKRDDIVLTSAGSDPA